jgi:hypothetical protein
MRRIVLDTDVASLSIKQQLPPALLRHIVGAQVGITFVTLGELSRWATLRRWGATRGAGRMAGCASGTPLQRSPSGATADDRRFGAETDGT